MRYLYLIICYIQDSTGTMKVRTVQGFTYILRTAQLYVDTHPNLYCEILVFEGINSLDIQKSIFDEFGFDIRHNDEFMIKVWSSKDGTYHIVDSYYEIENLLYEVGLVDELIKSGVQTYIKMSTLSPYMKDINFKFMIDYIINISLRKVFKHITDDSWYQYDMTQTIENYPLDLVNALVINGYMTAIEQLQGDNKIET